MFPTDLRFSASVRERTVGAAIAGHVVVDDGVAGPRAADPSTPDPKLAVPRCGIACTGRSDGRGRRPRGASGSAAPTSRPVLVRSVGRGEPPGTPRLPTIGSREPDPRDRSSRQARLAESCSTNGPLPQAPGRVAGRRFVMPCHPCRSFTTSTPDRLAGAADGTHPPDPIALVSVPLVAAMAFDAWPRATCAARRSGSARPSSSRASGRLRSCRPHCQSRRKPPGPRSSQGPTPPSRSRMRCPPPRCH